MKTNKLWQKSNFECTNGLYSMWLKLLRKKKSEAIAKFPRLANVKQRQPKTKPTTMADQDGLEQGEEKAEEEEVRMDPRNCIFVKY